MFINLSLDRPLAVIDLETTGTDPMADRIVEISVLKFFPDGCIDHRTRRVNPGMPIPEEASAIHGIRDADVATEPRFARIAAGLVDFLDGCDLCGFNIKRFDLRVLLAEFGRVRIEFPLFHRVIIDPMEIFHARERRDLTAAVWFYCGRKHVEAHGAAADALAAAKVLDAMLAHYQDLPKTVEGFRDCTGGEAVDPDGCFVRSQGQVLFRFGKHRGRRLDDVARDHSSYLTWMLQGSFFEDTKEMVREALHRSCGRSDPVA
jgi:DNA polymerase-3 subunit epsilon